MESVMPPEMIASMLDEIDIELSGNCNANCVFCPRTKITREKTTMSPDVFKKLIRDISLVYPDGPRVIYFCGIGEPLLNKNLCDFADTISNVFPDTLIVVVSNGSLLDKSTCDAIAAGGVFAFSCSMQSIQKDSYEAVMRGPSFDSVMHWIKYLAEKQYETGIKVTVTYVRTTQTDKELEEYYQFWKKLGIQVGELRLHNRGGFLENVGSGEKRERTRCSLFNRRLFVAANGDVLSCCQDLDGQSRLGTIGIDPLPLILERKMDRIMNGRLYPMCAKCTDAVADS